MPWLMWTLSGAAAAEPVDLSAPLEAIRADAEVPGALVAGFIGREQTANGQAGTLTVDQAVHLGSCTKAMTATAAARLHQAGKLDLEAPVSQWLDVGAGHADTTLVDLLSHTGGVRDKRMGRWLDVPASEVAAERLALTAEALSTKPRKGWRYSNVGYVVAGEVARAASGAATWEDVIQTEVFEPLGMEGCGFGAPPDATGHRRAAGGWVADTMEMDVLGAAGTVHCPLAAWGRFVSAHATRDSTYLPAELWDRLHEPVEAGYALGWFVQADRMYHQGSNGLWLSEVLIYPATAMSLLVVIDAGDPHAEAVLQPALQTLATAMLQP